MQDSKLDCRSCSENLRIDRGCKNDSPIPARWQINEWEFQRCPLSILDTGVFEYLRAYKRYEKGYLPNEGGWLDQAAKFNEAMDIIDEELAKKSEEKLKNRSCKQ